jgi:mono/diheme cytochrome c family protein
MSALALCALIGVLACSDGKAPSNSSGQAASAPAKPAAPAAQSGAVGAAPADGRNEPATVADIFPAGQGRDVVLNNCGSCHNLACSAIGQRTAARWQSLRESHKDKVTDADAAAAFT